MTDPTDIAALADELTTAGGISPMRRVYTTDLCLVDQCTKKRARYRPMCGMHIERVRRTGTTDPTVRSRGSLEERYWRRVIKGQEPGNCWGWNGPTGNYGYGLIRAEGGRAAKLLSSHRVSYTLHHGPIPEGYEVMHTCDNPPCSNPLHLQVGTHLENMTDAKVRGRMRKRGRK